MDLTSDAWKSRILFRLPANSNQSISNHRLKHSVFRNLRRMQLLSTRPSNQDPSRVCIHLNSQVSSQVSSLVSSLVSSNQTSNRSLVHDRLLNLTHKHATEVLVHMVVIQTCDGS
jgi:hypothetical protein